MSSRRTPILLLLGAVLVGVFLLEWERRHEAAPLASAPHRIVEGASAPAPAPQPQDTGEPQPLAADDVARGAVDAPDVRRPVGDVLAITGRVVNDPDQPLADARV